jgi:hypothetical protein
MLAEQLAGGRRRRELDRACGSRAERRRATGARMIVARQPETFRPVTLGHIRSHGCRDLLVYCASGWCHHSVVMNADWLSNDTPVRLLRSRMVCTECGLIGAERAAGLVATYERATAPRRLRRRRGAGRSAGLPLRASRRPPRPASEQFSIALRICRPLRVRLSLREADCAG